MWTLSLQVSRDCGYVRMFIDEGKEAKTRWSYYHSWSKTYESRRDARHEQHRLWLKWRRHNLAMIAIRKGSAIVPRKTGTHGTVTKDDSQVPRERQRPSVLATRTTDSIVGPATGRLEPATRHIREF